eukprot:gb/GECH01007279.1/.p1 GENE.gb/GECH01007279.1/~~gb/GECH01007279.1/.p1  ORF type:complete len:290 (+),score=80.26 gb/GECH01007279.1/:1-870(+)
MSNTFNPETYKSQQAERWSRGANTTWMSLKTREITTNTPDFFLHNDHVPIQPGSQVLDLACGTGETTLKVTERVSSGDRAGEGHVTAVDFAPGMIENLKHRAQEKKLSSYIDAYNCDALEFPLLPKDQGDGYDVVISQYGVMFFPELDTVMQRVHRSLKDQGVFAGVIWGTREQCPMFTVASAVVDPPQPAPGAPTTIGSQSRVEQALRGANMEIVEVKEFPVVFEFEDSKDFILTTGGINKWLPEQLGEEGSPKWNQMVEHLEKHFAVEGSKKIRFKQIAVGIVAIKK